MDRRCHLCCAVQGCHVFDDILTASYSIGCILHRLIVEHRIRRFEVGSCPGSRELVHISVLCYIPRFQYFHVIIHASSTALVPRVPGIQKQLRFILSSSVPCSILQHVSSLPLHPRNSHVADLGVQAGMGWFTTGVMLVSTMAVVSSASEPSLAPSAP